jgi:hypothetical protein
MIIEDVVFPVTLSHDPILVPGLYPSFFAAMSHVCMPHDAANDSAASGNRFIT